jgi:hypothetical protein
LATQRSFFCHEQVTRFTHTHLAYFITEGIGTMSLRPLVLSAAIAFAFAFAFAAPAAQAIQLLAVGELTGSAAAVGKDLSGLTGALENGIAGNFLGGLGSGMAWAGGNTFIAVPDRGPNATAYNPLVDDTSSYIARFQTLTMQLTANAAGSALAFSLTPTLTATTLLSSATALTYGTGALGTGNSGGATFSLGSGVPLENAANHTNYFTGRSDGFDAGKGSLNPNNARLDPEGVRVSNDGKSVFISDEYGPYVYQFDRATGQRIKAFALPIDLAVAKVGPTTTSEGAPFNTSGRVANKGMEGLAITPDGKTLVGVMQAPLLQDTNKNIRIVTIDIATGATKQYAYKLTDGSGVSEITALNDHEFLLDERDGKGLGDGSAAVVKKLYKVNLTGAVDVAAKSGDLSSFAVAKTQFMDIRGALVASLGIADTLVPAKIEGVTFGADINVNGIDLHTLWITNDNDFVPGIAGGNKFYVFGVSDADLAGSVYTGQSISAIPEPSTYALLLSGLGLTVWMGRKRRSAHAKTDQVGAL